MNNRRRAILRAFRRSLYWSTAWRVAEAAVQTELAAAGPGRPYTAAELLAEILDGLPPEIDQEKLRPAVAVMRGRRGPLRELIDDAPGSPTSPLGGLPRQYTPQKTNLAP